MAFFTPDYFVLDYETGGLPNTDNFRPIEVGLLSFRAGRATVDTFMVNPFVDDKFFSIHPTAQTVHGISAEMIRKDGLSPAAATARALATLTTGNEQIWTHNGWNFDFPLLEAECLRSGATPPAALRLRDSAAVYKALKLGIDPRNFASFNAFASHVFGMRRKGLFFNLMHIADELDLGVTLLRDPQTQQVLRAEIDHERLGLNPDDVRLIEQQGAHRAGFDVIVTHALVLWASRSKNLFPKSALAAAHR